MTLPAMGADCDDVGDLAAEEVERLLGPAHVREEGVDQPLVVDEPSEDSDSGEESECAA